MIENMDSDGLSGVQWTLLLPLLSRARITRRFSNLLNDPKAIEVVQILSGPLAAVDDVKALYNDLGNAARARVLDDAVQAFIRVHPEATIVNLGAGFDTAFSRNDNGTITWFDVDLPDVIELRKVIIPETGRSHCIAGSLLDGAWMREISPAQGGLFFFAGGVLPYFTRQEVKGILSSLAAGFPSSEFVFDAVSRRGLKHSNLWIKKAGIASAVMKWSLGRYNNLNKWDSRVVVEEHFPLFAQIERSPVFDESILRIMDECDQTWKMSIVHCRFAG